MKRSRSKPEPAAETDPRFPSGKWKGFWLQQSYRGRQWMSLGLTFQDGVVRGDGSDRVGNFSVQGKYDLRTGECSLIKSYHGAHSVIYKGRNENDGLWIWGLWRLPLDRGGFHMWPADEQDPTTPRRRAEQEIPQDKVRVKLVPSEVA